MSLNETFTKGSYEKEVPNDPIVVLRAGLHG
jgi:hypothetical protein